MTNEEIINVLNGPIHQLVCVGKSCNDYDDEPACPFSTERECGLNWLVRVVEKRQA